MVNQREEVSARQERAHRILNTAAELILRWGYNKTTIDDIARQSGVAKGTIYLHWKTREGLFEALMAREKAQVAEDFKQRVSKDPEGPTLRSIIKHSALAVMQRPLLKAVLLNDREVLGKLVHNDHNKAAYTERMMDVQTYLEYLREHKLVRTDLSLRAQVYTWNAIFMGFFLTTPLTPNEFKLSDEEIAELMAETVHRTLEPDRIVSVDDVRSVSDNFTEYVNRFAASAEEQFKQDLES